MKGGGQPVARSTFAAPLAGPTVAGVARLYFSLVPPAAGHPGRSKCRRAAQIQLAGRLYAARPYGLSDWESPYKCTRFWLPLPAPRPDLLVADAPTMPTRTSGQAGGLGHLADLVSVAVLE